MKWRWKNLSARNRQNFEPYRDHLLTRSPCLLNYAHEIKWFDQHFARCLALLESRGELANTIVIVTSDNGMAFPAAKALCYEYGIHVPLAIAWPAQVAGGAPGR